MLATAQSLNHYTKPNMYDNKWIDNHTKPNPWFNCLTIPTIPEESDVIDFSKRTHTDSECSSSSMEDFYVVLEVERPRLINEPINTVEKPLNFAKIIDDEPFLEYDQLVQPLTIEVSTTECAIANLTPLTLLHNANWHVPKIMSKPILKFSKESLNNVKRKTSYKIIKSNSSSISFILTNEQIRINGYSIESLDSIENNSPKQTRTTKTTFANLALQRKLNPITIQQQREKSFIEKTKLKHTFALDHARTEKFNRVDNEKMNYIDKKNNNETVLPFYLERQPQTNNNNNNNNTNNRCLPSNDLHTTSPVPRLVQKRSRAVKSEYFLPDEIIKSTEPSLLQVKYHDGRPTLVNNHTRELFEKSEILTSSISSRTSFSKMCQTDDLSTNGSLRKRLLNRFQNLFKSDSTGRTKTWQHKTIFELFGDRKN